MYYTNSDTVLSELDCVFEELSYLESIINVTLSFCNNNNFTEKERNNYTNMLSIANNKVNYLKEHFTNLENELTIYNKIPTIAADK